MYVRKTNDAAELSAALSRASKSRKSFRGGRPKKSEKDGEGQPLTTFAVGALDARVFKSLAKRNGWTIRQLLHAVAAMIVYGKPFSPHREYAPEGWRYVPPSQRHNGG